MSKLININSPKIEFGNCQYIMIDTCTAKNIMNGQEEALKFAKATADNNIVLCYSIKTIEELNIINQRINIPPNKRQAMPNMGYYLTQGFIQTEQILNKLNKLPNMLPEAIGVINNEITKKATENGKEYKLRWGDSIIYTLAVENDIDGIWTYDGDYKSVSNNITIFKGNVI